MDDRKQNIINFNIKHRPGRPASVFDAEELKEYNTLAGRLYEARNKNHLSQKDLTEQLEQYNIHLTSSAVSKWEKGISLPNPYQLFALCHILKISDPVSFFTGIQPESADFTPALSKKGLNILNTVKEALIASGQYKPEYQRRTTGPAEMIKMREMRISTNKASAGTGNFLNEDQFETLSFPVSQVPENADFGIRIVGDSMMPYYSDGQIVWVEKCIELNPGEVGIFIYDGEGYIKQYSEVMPSANELDEYTCNGIVYPKIYLVSLNREKYEPKLVNPEFGFEIVGRVLN